MGTSNELDGLRDLLAERVWLRRLAISLTQDEAAADDLAQDTLLAAMRKAPANVRRPRAWLGTVARRLWWNRERGRTRRAGYEADATPQRRAAPTDRVVARAELLERLGQMVLRLPDPYRVTLLLRFLEGRTHKEIAERLDVPLETVRSRTRRGLQLLRDELDSTHGDRRAWQALFLPLVPPHPTAVALGTSVATGGALAMSTKSKLLMIAVSLLALCVGYGVVELGWFQGAEESREPPALLDSDVAQDTPELEGHAPEPAPDLLRPELALPAPIDLGSVDRARDLHGRVADGSGVPVSGALLEIRTHPWRDNGLWGRGTSRITENLRTTLTAADGTFRFTLSPGEVVDLHAIKPGLATLLRRNCNAGERLDLVMQPGLTVTLNVVGASGEPVGDAQMRLFSTVSTRPACDRRGLTDARGRLEFEGLEGGGDVYVAAYHPDYGYAGWLPRKLQSAGAQTIEVTLPAGRPIKGIVTDASTGKPIAGAQVGSNWTMSYPTTTSEDGAYVWGGWTGKGTSVLTAAAEGYAPLQLEVGEARVIDFALVPGRTLTGRVLGPDGEPLAGAQVAGRSAAWSGLPKGTAYIAMRTGDDGRFALSGIHSDRAFSWTVLSEPLAQYVGENIEPGQWAEGSVDVGDIELEPGGAVQGLALESGDEPASRLWVHLASITPGRQVRGGENRPYRISRQRYTDDLGRFRFQGLPPGPYRLSARPAGQQEIAQQVVVPPGEDVLDVRIVIPRARKILVRVQTKEGRGVEGANISLMGKQAGGLMGGIQGGGGTDRNGEFTLLATDAVQQVSISWSQEWGRKWVHVGSPVHMLRADDEEIVFLVQRVDYTSGRVMDENDKPISGVYVRLTSNLAIMDTTDAKGHFELRTPAGAVADLIVNGQGQRTGENGQVRSVSLPIYGRAEGVAPGSRNVEIIARTVALTGSLRVRVEMPDGSPATNPFVYLQDAGGSQERPDPEEPDLRVLVKVPVRPVTVYAQVRNKEGRFTARLQDVDPNGQEVTLRLEKRDE